MSANHSGETPRGAADAHGPGGAILGKGAVLIWNDVASEGRRQFYDWHDKEHIPERLAIPGFRRGRRYVRRLHSPEWFTMYEADDLEIVTSPAYIARLNAPTPATTRTLPFFRNTSRAVCRLESTVGASTGGHVLTLRLGVPEGRGGALSRWAADELYPAALAQTGVIACHLYAADERASFANTAESRTRSFDVPSWVLLAEATVPEAAEFVRGSIAGPALARLGVAVRDDAAVYALEICRLAPAASMPGET